MVAKGHFSPQFTAYNNSYRYKPKFTHLYLTSKYLNVPGHGSPKTKESACSSQLASSLHFNRTMKREFAALQFVSLTAE